MFCIIAPRNDCIILNCGIILAWPKFRPIKTRYQNLDRVWLLEHNNSWCINNKKHCDHQRKNPGAMIQVVLEKKKSHWMYFHNLAAIFPWKKMWSLSWFNLITLYSGMLCALDCLKFALWFRTIFPILLLSSLGKVSESTSPKGALFSWNWTSGSE